MATKDSTYTQTKLAQFSSAKDYEKRAIVLRSQGMKIADIVDAINKEFNLTYTYEGVRNWFENNGKLKQAIWEYNEMMADQSLAQAKQLARRLSREAIMTMGKLMGKADSDAVRLNAARAIADKYLPNKQALTLGAEEEDTPAELLLEGDSLFDDESTDTQDDTPEGGTVGQEDGGEEGEDLSTGLLREQDPGDGPGDPQA